MMTTFTNTYGPEPMLGSVGQAITEVERHGVDVHTVTLLLNGQHGEFDLTIEATDDDLENRRWTGVAHRFGGVAGLHE